MSKSLIRKNQLHPDISDLVGEYGSGFFISINSSGDLINSLAEVVSGDFANTVRTTGDQTVSGVKAFILRPTVNGTGVLLSGEAAQADLSSTVRTTGNQTISGVKTFQNSIFYGLASGSFDLGLRTNISSGSGASVSFTRGGTIPSVHGYGIVFEGGSIANKKGYLTVGQTVAPVGYQYASLDWTSRILSGAWSASSPIRVGSAVPVMTTGNQTISGVKTFQSEIAGSNDFGFYMPLQDQGDAPAKGLKLIGGNFTGSKYFGEHVFISGGRGNNIGGHIVLQGGNGAVLNGEVAGWGELFRFNGTTIINNAGQITAPIRSFTRPIINGTGVLLSGEAVASNGTINSMIKLTQAQYNALSPVDPTTFYVIVG
jgi:hypothetical protein